MRKRRKWAILLPVLLLCTGCQNSEGEPSDIRDALQIMVYTCTHIPGEEGQHPDKLVTLALNEPVTVCMSDRGEVNLNLQLLFPGGECEVTDPNKNLMLSVDPHYRRMTQTDVDRYQNRQYGYTLTIPHEGYINVCVLTGARGDRDFGAMPELYEFYEYYNTANCLGMTYDLVIKAKDYDTTMVTAKLRLTQMADKSTIPKYFKGEFKLELISYEYSFMYDMIQEGA